jgi:hypothetical protein
MAKQIILAQQEHISPLYLEVYVSLAKQVRIARGLVLDS